MNSASAPLLPQDEQPENERLDNARLRRELSQARAELEDFTYSVSHDLRASLRHVTAYVQIIKEDLGDQSNAAMAAHLETVSQAARNMGQQIDALMELSRLTQVALQLSTVDAGQLVAAVGADLAPMLAGRAIEWQVAADLPPLCCDAALLRQVVMHLLSNALKFTRTRPLSRIGITWQAHDHGQCAITVTDNGVGFNPQYQGKLFHAFQRLHGAREFEGLGMGLALTRKIVERHGGVVWASGAPDAGCSISFTLPLA